MKQVYFGGGGTGSPDTPEWHTWRGNGIGGSDTIAFLDDVGIPRPSWANSKHALWLKKTGQGPETVVNAAMQRGRDGEEPARIAYETETGIRVQPAFGEADFWSVIRSSLDGMPFMGGDVIAEIKCPSAKVHALAKAGEVVSYYKPQIAHQAMVRWDHPETWVAGQEIHYYSFVPETGDGALVVVPALELRALAEKLIPVEKAFWDAVMNRTAPCGEEFEATAKQFIAADEELEGAKASKEALRQRLIDIAGGKAKMEGGGVSVTRKAGTLDCAKAAAGLGLEQAFLAQFRPINHAALLEAAIREGLLAEAFIDSFRGDVDYAAAIAAAKIEEARLAAFRADDGGYVVSVAGKRAKKAGGA